MITCGFVFVISEIERFGSRAYFFDFGSPRQALGPFNSIHPKLSFISHSWRVDRGVKNFVGLLFFNKKGFQGLGI